MQIVGQNSISGFRKVINENDLIPGDGLQASGRTWATVKAEGKVGAAMVAQITNTGPIGTENDFSDYHYWVDVQQNNTNMSAGTFLAGGAWNLSTRQISGGTVANTSNYVLLAVNPGEVAAKSHSLSVGQYVTIAPVYMDQVTDGIAPQTIRWIILGTSSSDQQFIVTGHPAQVNVSGNMVTPAYVYAKTYSNVSTGSMNISVGVIQAHSIGEIFTAEPVSQINSGGAPLTYPAMNGGSGMANTPGGTVVWKESGSYGLTFECACNQSGGTNGSATALCTYTYIPIVITSGGGNLGLVTNPLTPLKPRLLPMTLMPATECLMRINIVTGTWEIMEAWESTQSLNCGNSSSGSSATSTDFTTVMSYGGS